MKTPLSSIVILTKNGGFLFKKSIEKIFSQKTCFDYEVIIVDSGSTDGTIEFLNSYPVKIFSINSKNFSFGTTRDFGFSLARGEYIVTLSQDVVPKGENWLQNLVSPLLNNDADIVQGSNEIPDDKDVFFWEKKNLFYFTSERERFRKKYGHISLSCTNVAIKKSIWESIKFGNTPMGEDIVFQKKAFCKGYKIFRSNIAMAYHGHSYNLRSLIKRCENEGLGWKYAKVTYSFFEMLKDLKQKRWIYGILIRGILNGDIKRLAEVLFLQIRPVFLYKGNRFTKKYIF